MPAGESLGDGLAIVFTALLAGYLLWLLVARLRASRPGLAIGAPTAAALLVATLAAAGVSITGIASTLRGGDEIVFLRDAGGIAATPFGSTLWSEALTGQLHVFVLAVQTAVLDPPEFALRVTQAGIAVAGLVLLATAVYELAGGRAATIAMWVMALEPTGIFFSTLLHKEANMTLAAGLVAFGGTLVWKRSRLTALLPIALGCLIAVATRPYVGWFLIAAGAAMVLHAGLRQRRESGLRSLTLVAAVVLLVAVTAPTVLGATGNERLEQLQKSQDANTRNEKANLALERVDFSTRGAIVTNLPARVSQILTQPFPWQLQNLSQQVGLLGTFVAYVVLALLLAELVRSRGAIMRRAGPLVYTAAFILVAYSLAAGNAGTAFRYRSHLIVFGACLVVTLWQLRTREGEQPVAQPLEEGRRDLPGRARAGVIS